MSGQSTCRSIAQIRENGNTNRAAIGALGNAINPVGSIVSGLSAQNNSDNAIINIIRQNARSIQDMLVKNKCDNISSLRQENIFRENPICFTSLIETCKNTITGETNLECLREVRKFLNDRPLITQENRNKVQALCEINSAIQAIAGQEASAQNVALLESMQEAKGLLSRNNSEGLNCNEVDTNITNEQYLKVVLDCMQETAVTQSNILEGCHPRVTNQINVNDDMKRCLISAGIIQQSSQSTSARNDSSLKNKQTAVGLDPAASLASLIPLIIISCILIVLVIIFLPMIQKK
jgi:hypothetical protein